MQTQIPTIRAKRITRDGIRLFVTTCPRCGKPIIHGDPDPTTTRTHRRGHCAKGCFPHGYYIEPEPEPRQHVSTSTKYAHPAYNEKLDAAICKGNEARLVLEYNLTPSTVYPPQELWHLRRDRYNVDHIRTWRTPSRGVMLAMSLYDGTPPPELDMTTWPEIYTVGCPTFIRLFDSLKAFRHEIKDAAKARTVQS